MGTPRDTRGAGMRAPRDTRGTGMAAHTPTPPDIKPGSGDLLGQESLVPLSPCPPALAPWPVCPRPCPPQPCPLVLYHVPQSSHPHITPYPLFSALHPPGPGSPLPHPPVPESSCPCVHPSPPPVSLCLLFRCPCVLVSPCPRLPVPVSLCIPVLVSPSTGRHEGEDPRVLLEGHPRVLPPERTPHGVSHPAALAAASPGGDECLEEDEDELEPGLDEAEAEPEAGSGGKAAGGARGAVLTRRGITLRVLLRDGLLEPARGVLSIYYLAPQGKKFVGDLGADGTITWQETGQVFNSPSAWATHCKRLVNPAKKSGCGWASVRYKGQKLDQYKAAWLRKHQPNAPPAEESLASEGEEEEMPEEEEEEATREGRAPVPEPAATKKPEEKSKKQQCKSLAEPAGTDHGPPGKRLESKPRVPVRYCTLGTRDSARNPQTLVEVTSFAAINKFQPFNVAISSNVLLLLDFHSHLTRSEVVGYLGGRWDTNTQLLTVLRAFPCRTRLGDAEAAGAVEEEICQSLFLRGLSLVGWYHSHPFGPALPSLHDIDAQMDYQLKLQGSGNGFQPCLALICGPYYHGNPGVESKIAPFWVMPPPEQRPNDYGIPMDVEVAYIQDGFLTNDVLQEMTLLVEFYKGAPDLVKFQELWSQDQTYLDKLKGSLASRTPKDQSFTHILEQIYSLLKLSS
ncbi:MPN domain-containing protein isoform X2 [Phalacrocorax aristotelis]|uniref:MPN domain-containing protein isoform X2 n=1 Tax=Phalacrocorax aristotelis TaxID=126867 RepID=UPI003F4B4683